MQGIQQIALASSRRGGYVLLVKTDTQGKKKMTTSTPVMDRTCNGRHFTMTQHHVADKWLPNGGLARLSYSFYVCKVDGVRVSIKTFDYCLDMAAIRRGRKIAAAAALNTSKGA
jgi:hypothetical protein